MSAVSENMYTMLSDTMAVALLSARFWKSCTSSMFEDQPMICELESSSVYYDL